MYYLKKIVINVLYGTVITIIIVLHKLLKIKNKWTKKLKQD